MSAHGFGPAIIEVEGLSKHYGDVRAVDDVSFSVAEGEILGLLGHNGAGKTTTIRMLTGRARPLVGRARPVSMRMVVVLPAPLWPRRPRISPSATLKLTSSTARRSP